MRRNARRSISAYITWSIVLGWHVLLIVLFTKAGGIRIRLGQADNTRGLLLLDLPPPVEQQLPARSRGRRQLQMATPNPGVRRDLDVPATPPALPAVAPSADFATDWRREAEDVARSHTDEGTQSKTRSLGDLPQSPYRRCAKRPEPQWDPEPKKFGFAGGLPYVRLGKHCVVVLGLFGCVLGKLPEANGRLFDHLGDTNTSRGSVPENEDCQP